MNERKLQSVFSWQQHSFVVGGLWPQNRIARAFFMLVPWIDLMAAAVLIAILAHGTIVQPGRVVELAQEGDGEGLLANRASAVVRRGVQTVEGKILREWSVLLLDEGRYSSNMPDELAVLDQVRPGAELNLLVDRGVSYEEVMQWVERLHQCGVERINFVETQGE